MQTSPVTADSALALVRAARGVSLPPPDERRSTRHAFGVSTADLAAALGVTAQTVRNYESGRREPRGPHRELYAAVLASMRAELGGDRRAHAG